MTSNEFVTKYLDTYYMNETSGGMLTLRARSARERNYRAMRELDEMLAAERERCAKVVEESAAIDLRATVAARIRSLT